MKYNTKKKTITIKNVKKMFKNIMTTLENEEELAKYVIGKNKFTRKRKIPIEKMAKLLFTGVLVTIPVFISIQLRKESVTKQAFSKARKNISHKLFEELNNRLVKEIYKKYKIKRYNEKYIILAIDGTTIEIPNTEEMRETFGKTKSQKGAKQNARASASCIYDSLNEIIVRTKLEKYNTSEREMAKEMIEETKEIYKPEETIYIMDRGYYAKWMVGYFIKNRMKFIFRVSKGVLKKYYEEIETDEIVRIKVKDFCKGALETSEEVKMFEGQEEIRLRLTKIELATKEIEYIVTNIEDIKYSEMKELYFKRWKIEINYDLLKNKIGIENFSGRSEITIYQDYYARILNANIGSLIVQSTAKKRSKKGKEYQVNKNKLIGLYKKQILEKILIPIKKLLRLLGEIREEINRHQEIKAAEGRRFLRPKNDKVKANKYRTNMRPN